MLARARRKYQREILHRGMCPAHCGRMLRRVPDTPDCRVVALNLDLAVFRATNARADHTLSWVYSPVAPSPNSDQIVERSVGDACARRVLELENAQRHPC